MNSEEFYSRNLKHNFVANILDGGFYSFGMGMVPLTTVILYFVSDFVSQKWIIGLLPSLFYFLVFSPQVLITRKIESLPYYKPFTIFLSFLHRLPWLLMALDVYFFAESNPKLFIVIFYFLYSMIGLTLGFSGLTVLCLISKIIPNNARGRLMGIKSSVSGIFELGGSVVMGVVLKSRGYPVNYVLLFLIVFIASLISLVFLSTAKEIKSENCPIIKNDVSYVRKMFGILKSDKPNTFFIISIVCITAMGKIPFNFQTVYAKDKLGISAGDVFLATIVLIASQTIGYLVWGYIGDRYGHRYPLIACTGIFIPAILFTYLMTNQTIFLISFCLLGVAQSAFNVNLNNLSIDLCKDKSNLPTYIGLRCFVTGPFIAFSSLLGGFIIDHFGYNLMFIISVAFLFLGLYLLTAKVKMSTQNL